MHNLLTDRVHELQDLTRLSELSRRRRGSGGTGRARRGEAVEDEDVDNELKLVSGLGGFGKVEGTCHF